MMMFYAQELLLDRAHVFSAVSTGWTKFDFFLQLKNKTSVNY